MNKGDIVLKPLENLESLQISLTGMRSLILLGLLIAAPRSLEEIKQAFLYYKVIDDTTSDDILRIDLNTLKAIGCEIPRCSPKTGYKYVLEQHPFSLKLTEEDIKILKRVYNGLKSQIDLKALIKLDSFFKKISEFIFEEKIKEALLGISILKRYNISIVEEILEDCRQNSVLTIIYRKRGESKESQKEIQVNKLANENNKIYLYGYDLDAQRNTVLEFKGIKAILSRRISNKTYSENPYKIKYKLKNINNYNLTDQEHVIETTETDLIIEGVFYNKFWATQRVLYFGNNCTVLEPIEFRAEIINKLKEMRKRYE